MDGEVQKPNLGEFDHAVVQGFLTGWFFQHPEQWQLHALPEMRIRVSTERVRIPDICLVARSQPSEQVATTPALVVIEILSPVIDPANRVSYDCSTTAWLPVEEFRVAGGSICLRLDDVWSELQGKLGKG